MKCHSYYVGLWRWYSLFMSSTVMKVILCEWFCMVIKVAIYVFVVLNNSEYVAHFFSFFCAWNESLVSYVIWISRRSLLSLVWWWLLLYLPHRLCLRRKMLLSTLVIHSPKIPPFYLLSSWCDIRHSVKLLFAFYFIYGF